MTSVSIFSFLLNSYPERSQISTILEILPYTNSQPIEYENKVCLWRSLENAGRGVKISDMNIFRNQIFLVSLRGTKCNEVTKQSKKR
ncbi:MAG: hypothetical protein A2287_01565 [Candidatus Melainabacteria bacterium RIFOXYA12_FULL_32_12]|nr:MAG: hypothetical protein A2255_04270 [Candidatus Melainabacteria bacterium RIFOXYA2_FULL_32_9]OGI31177.1 MAG: hypothetical protein A2287_01565 [Candidatus Melainabacteria bacterium RIFOXYA12_FULL_32_12]